MRTLVIFLIGFILDIALARSQNSDLFIPLEIKKAYRQGTRSMDGKPGPNYWQNTVEYDITARFDPKAHLLEGHEEITYHNNSPDHLKQIVIRLYGDAFKKGAIRLNSIDPDDAHDGMEIWNLVVGGDSLEPDDDKIDRTGTNMVIVLDDPIAPGEKIDLSLSWKHRIPKERASWIRTRGEDSSVFFISYWYPQISVYDDLFGWDMTDHLFEHEFYNNLASFNVEIHVPKDFSIWSTGVMKNPEEVFPDSILNRFRKAQETEKRIQIIGSEDLQKGIEYSGKAWKFKADKATDFAFATSNRYNWDASIAKLKSKKVMIHTAYPYNSTKNYDGYMEEHQKMMKHFSEDAPGIEFPYPTFSSFVVKGRGGGMEYPMIAYNGGTGLGLTIHEMFHSYFPMWVRVNETYWSWMDEGINEFITKILYYRHFDKGNLQDNLYIRLSQMGKQLDLPLITPTHYLNSDNTQQQNYGKPEVVNGVLYEYLGEETYIKSIQSFINNWAEKAPSPYDYFFTFESTSGEDLSWIWKPWFFEFGAADLEIVSFTDGALKIRKIGKRPCPILLDVFYKNGDTIQIRKNAGIWKTGNNESSISIPDPKKVVSIRMNQKFPESDYSKNFYPPIENQYDQEELEKIVGNYVVSNRNWSWTISLKQEGDGLYFYWNNPANPAYNNSKLLLPLGDFSFLSQPFGVNWKFEVDKDGKVKGSFESWGGLEIEKID